MFLQEEIGMQSAGIRKEYRQFVFYLYTFIQFILFIIIFSIGLTIDSLQKYLIFTLIIGVLVVLFNIFIHIKRQKNELYKSLYIVKSLKHQLDLPNSFVKNVVLIMPDGKPAYYFESKIIPESFIEIVEGKRAYLIKQLIEDKYADNFRLIYVSQKKYALVEDLTCKRHIVHFDNLKAI
jgi:c-di-AMP phosphodiesterase-like protein